MKLKHIVLAALAATAMGNAMATVTGSTSDSTLVLLVGDQNHSYLFDTGVSLASVIAGTANATFTLPNWSQYGAVTPFDSVAGTGTRWALEGGTYALAGNVQSLMVTGSLDGINDGSLDTTFKNSGVKSDALKLNDYAGQVATALTAGNIVNSSSSAYASDAIFNIGYGFQQNGQAVVAGAGNEIGIYLESLSSTSNAKAATFTQMAEFATLDTSTGTLTIGSPVAAVPEPESYALMLAGLVAGAFVVRRRQRD